MNTLRRASLVRLMKRRLLFALSLAPLWALLVPLAPVRATDVAMRTTAPSPSRIVLDLSKRQIKVLKGHQQLGPWPVAIGDPKTPTPKGEFSILAKKVNPVYVTTKSGQRRQLQGPSSPIGDRYLAFHRNGRGEFGIHGTPWPHWVQIRAAVSLGCVRMLNSHIRQLFDAVEVGTRLEIEG
ncbi:MAG: L,D-transpeptidase [Synechococcus sp. MED650]|nr:L,D-transpeptidase [Synechococcus sp. MED650]OUW57746.1 MAG: L,D-transpeptidase [Cyanobacteria bacterium TMED188]